MRFFRNKVGSPEQAEELTQRTFEGAVTGVVRFRDGASARTWLFAIARNVLRQWAEETARARGRSGELDDASVADLGMGPSTVMARRREQRLMLEGLRRLPLESQLVLELFYWESSNPSDPNPPKRRDFGTKPLGLLGVLALVRVLPSPPASSRMPLSFGATGAALA